MMKKILVLLSIVLLFSGCATVNHPYIKVYKDPSKDLSLYKKFYITPHTDKTTNPLINKIIDNMVKEQLIKKGYMSTDDIDQSDFFLGAFYENNYKKVYVRPHQEIVPVTDYEYTEFRGFPQRTQYGAYTVIPTSNPSAVTQKTTYMPVTTDGYYTGCFYPIIRIYIKDTKQAAQDFENNTPDDDALFWSGSTGIVSEDGDLTKHAPKLIASILKDFPNRVEKEQKDEIKKPFSKNLE